MKLYRNLIYILASIFLIGIFWVCLAEPQSVMSRIATGLITGSFVGAINTFVSYMYQRTAFFDKMSSTLTRIGHELGNDYIDVVLKNEELASSKSEDIVNSYKKRTTEQKRALKGSEKKYEKLINKINVNEFSGIFPSDCSVKDKLHELDDVLLKVKDMYEKYRLCPFFRSLPARASEDTQSHLIGDPDQFFNDWVKSNREFKGSVASSMIELGNICKGLSESLLGTISKDMSSVMVVTSQYLRDTDGSILDDLDEEWEFEEEGDVNEGQ